MANKIRYGLKNVHYAKATIDESTGEATYTTPVAIPGAVTLSLEAQGDRSVYYADDVEYFVSVENQGYEGDLEVALIPEQFEEDILGAVKSKKNVLIEETDPEIVHFALLFEFKGDKNRIRHAMYNCTATRPSVEGETKGENIEPHTEKLSLRASSVYNSALDKDVVKGKTMDTVDSTVYDNWYSSVFQPTTASEA